MIYQFSSLVTMDVGAQGCISGRNDPRLRGEESVGLLLLRRTPYALVSVWTCFWYACVSRRPSLLLIVSVTSMRSLSCACIPAADMVFVKSVLSDVVVALHFAVQYSEGSS